MASIWRADVDRPCWIKLGLVTTALAVAIGLVVAAAMTRKAEAEPAQGTLAACVSLYTGQTRILYPGQSPNCSQYEFLVEWNGQGIQGPVGPPGPQGEPGATNITRRVSAQAIVPPGGSNTATVECLEGEQVTGGGHIVNDNTPELLPIILESDISDTGNGWKVKIYSLAGEPDAMEIQAVAMCASP